MERHVCFGKPNRAQQTENAIQHHQNEPNTPHHFKEKEGEIQVHPAGLRVRMIHATQ